MKKVLALVLAVIMALGICACGNNSDESEIADLLNEGYEIENLATSDNTLGIIFHKDASYIKVTTELSDLQMKKLEEVELLCDAYDVELQAFLITLVDIETEDLSERVPEQSELDKYVGMTVAELEAAELMQLYSCIGESESTFGYTDYTYKMDMTAVGCENVEDVTDIPAEVLNEIVITSVSFAGFADDILFV